MPEVVEVELKFPALSWNAIVSRVEELGGLFGAPVEQTDVYLAHPCRDFATTDEALRLRNDGNRWFLTYKGPRLDGHTKTRSEVEVPLNLSAAEITDVFRIFELLGFRPVGRVVKKRRKASIVWQGRAVVITWDEVQGLGDFVELEATAREPDVPNVQRSLLDLAESLGLDSRRSQRKSYLELLLERGLVP
ncbi:MAG: adenylate cyclase [Pirellulaceae bacterium]|nr:MAG: adenylate cyclase [Pirellulaceae bacterium]